jgi:hypothetical protein
MNQPGHRGVRNKGKVAAGRRHPGTRPKGAKKTHPKRQKRVPSHPVSERSVALTTGASLKQIRANRAMPSSTGLRRIVLGEVQSPASGIWKTIIDQRINAGNNVLHPDVAAMADMFEQYRYRVFRLRFVHTAAATVSGTLMLHIDRDPTDAAPGNVADTLANQISAATAPYEDSVIELRDKRWFWTRLGSDTSTDVALARQNSPGQMRCTVSGVGVDNTSIGWLELEYDIEYRTWKPTTVVSACSQTVTPVLGFALTAASQQLRWDWPYNHFSSRGFKISPRNATSTTYATLFIPIGTYETTASFSNATTSQHFSTNTTAENGLRLARYNATTGALVTTQMIAAAATTAATPWASVSSSGLIMVTTTFPEVWYIDFVHSAMAAAGVMDVAASTWCVTNMSAPGAHLPGTLVSPNAPVSVSYQLPEQLEQLETTLDEYKGTVMVSYGSTSRVEEAPPTPASLAAQLAELRQVIASRAGGVSAPSDWVRTLPSSRVMARVDIVDSDDDEKKSDAFSDITSPRTSASTAPSAPSAGVPPVLPTVPTVGAPTKRRVPA